MAARGSGHRLPIMTERKVLAVAAGAVLLIAASGCGVAGGATVHEQRSFDVPADDVVIEAENGDMSIVTGDSDKIEVDRWVDENADATWTMDGSTLRLEVDGGFLSFGEGARYEVTVPEELAVRVNGTNGDLDVSGLRSGLVAESENGDVTAEDIDGGPVELRTTNGEIRLDQRAPVESLSVESQNGDIHVSLLGDGTYAIETRTQNGDENVSVEADPDAGRTLDAVTTNGDITIDAG